MWRFSHRPIRIALCLGVALAAAGLALADDVPAPQAQATQQDDWQKVMQLGDIQVEGDREEASRKIIAGLKVIKRALVAKLSNDPAHANDIVCRMNYDTGSHVVVHLRCATNGALAQERESRATGMLADSLGTPSGAEEQALEHIENTAPRDRYFSTRVSGPELQKLLVLVQCEGCSNSGLVVGNN